MPNSCQGFSGGIATTPADTECRIEAVQDGPTGKFRSEVYFPKDAITPTVQTAAIFSRVEAQELAEMLALVVSGRVS